jgi:2-iminobutanoate/2-iminopropanoate deaminase
MNQDNCLIEARSRLFPLACRAKPNPRQPPRIQGVSSSVEASTPPGTPKPIGPYSHIAKVGPYITIGGTAGFDRTTGQLVGSDIAAQTKRILESLRVMLASVDSDLAHVVHINVFLLRTKDFDPMNAAYVEVMGQHRPARTVIAVSELPKPGVLLTMNLTAVTKES